MKIITNTDLRLKNMQDRKLIEYSFKHTDLRRALLSGSELENCEFNNTRLDSTAIQNARLDNCIFQEAHLTGIDASNTSFNDCRIIKTNAAGSLFDKVILKNTHIESFYGPRISFKRAQLENCSFKIANLFAIDLSDTVLINSCFHSVDLRFANFKGAELINVSFCDILTTGLSASSNTSLKDCGGIEFENLASGGRDCWHFA